ncbi:MAG TPA: DUF2911 domain-containing protein [Vicinamibacterales bacterium]
MTIRCRRMAALTAAAALLVPLAAIAQDLHPSRRPSPLGMARTTIGDTYVRVIYGRPYKRGRNNIFGTKESGALVPYGERWRTGANEATEITVTGDVLVAGKKLPAGTYSLFTTPGPESWKVHFNSKLGLDGTGIFANNTFTPVDLDPTDVLVVTVPSKQLPENEEVDQLTFEFEPGASGGADMVLRWIRTEVRIPIAAGS